MTSSQGSSAQEADTHRATDGPAACLRDAAECLVGFHEMSAREWNARWPEMSEKNRAAVADRDEPWQGQMLRAFADMAATALAAQPAASQPGISAPAEMDKKTPAVSGEPETGGVGETIEKRFPVLNDHLIRMASTGTTGSLSEWGEAMEPDLHDGGGTHPISRRLEGFAAWLTWCLEGKFALKDTAPKFIAGMRDDMQYAARRLAALSQGGSDV